MIDVAGWLFLLAQVFFVDLLLGADNAIVIALACRRLPPEDLRRAVAFGAGGAIALRLCMILFANALLGVPFIKLIGAWTLIVIALNVRAQESDQSAALGDARPAADLMSAAAIIMVADAAMSLDNVVALAAIANGDFWLMALGVLMSIPILIYGAVILHAVIGAAPEILTIGAAFLGWIAGAMAVSDPLVAGWIGENAPALPIVAPPLAALFAAIAGRGAKPGETDKRRAPAIPRKPAREREAPRVTPTSPVAQSPVPVLNETSVATRGGWTEERVVVAGFVLLAFLAGLIILLASVLDSLA